ncbi:MAG: efflux RND transporter permease subunit [Myxococcaceae bacterium]|nr:efflux RND transporter permease subunit [Myxococcaceae bacterium]
MTLSDVSIRRPVFITMLSVLLLVMGVMGLRGLGTDLFPDVSFPVVVVTTVYKGAGPAEIEQQVVKPIEDSVAGISGVDMIHSWSRENVSIVVVQFKLSVSLDKAVQEVRDKVALTQSLLPKEADLPKVGKVDVSAAPVLTYAASAKLSSQELRKLVEDKLEPALAQLDGVAEIRITGGDKREIRVDIDLEKAKAAGLAPLQIAQQIGMENVDIPAGQLELGPTELTVRALGQLRTVDELRDLPMTSNAMSAQVKLGEIATVTDGVADRRTLARLNGTEAIIVEIVKQPGKNTLAVSDAVKARIAEIEPTMGNGFHASALIDQSLLIKENAKEVWVALIFGGAMAILIILVFLLDLRGTLISSLALPTSVVGTFFVMYLLNYSLNQMTLLALSLAIGLLIDDAVVVREAITHRLDRGESPRRAASLGTKDVGLAVLATTMSLVSVFIPVAFMSGIVGQFFKQFGITISAAVLISLFISFTLDPMLSSRFAKTRNPHEKRTENAIARVLRLSFEATERFYERLLGWVLANKVKTSLLTLAVLVASMVGASRLGAEFVPAEDRSQFMVDLELGDGASLLETTERVKLAEGVLKAFPETTDVYSVVGNNGDVNRARLRVLLKDKQERAKGLAVIKDEARSALTRSLPGTKVALFDPPVIEGAGDFYPIMVRLTGPDVDEATRQADRVAEILRKIKGTADVRVDKNPPKPSLQARIDRDRAADVGLTAAMMGAQTRLAMSGQTVGKLREGEDETDIVVRLAEEYRQTPETIRKLNIFTPKGMRMLEEVADVDVGVNPSVIERHNRERQVAVYANLGKGAALGSIASELKAELTAKPPPPGYAVVYDGQIKTFDEQNAAFASAIGLALIFLYMVLASQFESFKHPFTIMLSVPLAVIGALLSLLLTGYNLSLGAMIGVLLLMGLVTKNAILLVDGALQNMRAGDDVDTALRKAGPRRLRPILMTSAAMAIGMVPTAIGTGMGSEFRAPMAVAVIGGVITSTFLTLLVVPVVFAFFEYLTPKSLKLKPDSEVEQVGVEDPEERVPPAGHPADGLTLPGHASPLAQPRKGAHS